MRDDGPETIESTLRDLRAMVPVTVAYLLGLILVPLAFSVVMNQRGFHDHRPGRAEDSLREIEKVVQLFQIERGRLPFHLDELCTPTEEYEEEWFWDLPADPWKGRFYYRLTETGFLVGSTGPDRKKGTEDDIVLRSPR